MSLDVNIIGFDSPSSSARKNRREESREDIYDVERGVRRALPKSWNSEVYETFRLALTARSAVWANLTVGNHKSLVLLSGILLCPIPQV